MSSNFWTRKIYRETSEIGNIGKVLGLGALVFLVFLGCSLSPEIPMQHAVPISQKSITTTKQFCHQVLDYSWKLPESPSRSTALSLLISCDSNLILTPLIMRMIRDIRANYSSANILEIEPPTIFNSLFLARSLLTSNSAIKIHTITSKENILTTIPLISPLFLSSWTAGMIVDTDSRFKIILVHLLDTSRIADSIRLAQKFAAEGAVIYLTFLNAARQSKLEDVLGHDYFLEIEPIKDQMQEIHGLIISSRS